MLSTMALHRFETTVSLREDFQSSMLQYSNIMDSMSAGIRLEGEIHVRNSEILLHSLFTRSRDFGSSEYSFSIYFVSSLISTFAFTRSSVVGREWISLHINILIPLEDGTSVPGSKITADLACPRARKCVTWSALVIIKLLNMIMRRLRLNN